MSAGPKAAGPSGPGSMAGGRRGARARDCRPRGAAAQRDQLRPPPVRQPNTPAGRGLLAGAKPKLANGGAGAGARQPGGTAPAGAQSALIGWRLVAQCPVAGRTVRPRQQGSAARSEGPRGDGPGRPGPGGGEGSGSGRAGSEEGVVSASVPGPHAGRAVQAPGPSRLSGVREAPGTAERERGGARRGHLGPGVDLPSAGTSGPPA